MLNNRFSSGKFAALALAAALTAVVQGGVWHCFAANAEQMAMPAVVLPAVTITAQRAQVLPLARATPDTTPVAMAAVPAPQRQ